MEIYTQEFIPTYCTSILVHRCNGRGGASVEANAPTIFIHPRIFLATEFKTGKYKTAIFSE
jgi:hypothetical protein